MSSSASSQAARDNQELLCGVKAYLDNEQKFLHVVRALFRELREEQLDEA